MEALYSCHLDTFCTKPHVPKQHRPSRGKKRDRQKQKFPAPHPLTCLDFFPIRDRFVTHHAELSSTPQKIFAQPRHQPAQHNTTRHDTTVRLNWQPAVSDCETKQGVPDSDKGITTFYVAFSGLRSATSAMASSKVDQHQLQIIMPASSHSCPMFTTADLRVHQNLGHRTNLETIDSPTVALLQFSDGNELCTTITLSHELAHSHHGAD